MRLAILGMLLLVMPVHAVLLRGVVTEDRAQEFIVDDRAFSVQLLLAGEMGDRARALLAMESPRESSRRTMRSVTMVLTLRVQEVLVSSSGGLVRFYLNVPPGRPLHVWLSERRLLPPPVILKG